SDHWNWPPAAVLRLYLGDIDGYRQTCRDMLRTFRQTDNPTIADRIAKACLHAPDAVPDLGPVLQLAERGLTGTEQHWNYCWSLLTKGMADYRAGRFADAIDQLNKSISLGNEPLYHHKWYLTGKAYLFLAMAYHRVGNA